MLRAAQLHKQQLLSRPQCLRQPLCYCNISSRRDVSVKFPQYPFSQQDPVLHMHMSARKQLNRPAERRNSVSPQEEWKRQHSVVCGTLGQASTAAISRLRVHWQQFWVCTEHASKEYLLALRKASDKWVFSNIHCCAENSLLMSLNCTSVILTCLNAGPHHLGSELQGSLSVAENQECELLNDFLQVFYLAFNYNSKNVPLSSMTLATWFKFCAMKIYSVRLFKNESDKL